MIEKESIEISSDNVDFQRNIQLIGMIADRLDKIENYNHSELMNVLLLIIIDHLRELEKIVHAIKNKNP